MSGEQGFSGTIADLYDVFVDWEGRLGRELPGLTRRLNEAGARRVVDAGCGTGRHVAALLEAGFDAHGADLSEEMLERARACVGEPERLHGWRMGDDPPESVRHAAPFDALICLGNTWPQIVDETDVRASLRAFRALVRPGGLVLVGLKAVAIRREQGDPYMPLLRRQWQGRPLYFVRFLDFDVPRHPDGADVCELHFVIVRGDASGDEPDCLLHRVSRMRVWRPDGLAEAFAEEGFRRVRVSARLDDPAAAPTTEDVFVHAQAPS